MYNDASPQPASSLNSLKHKISVLAFKTGLTRFGRPLWSRWLTVINYHRIADVNTPDFDSFKPNVSATPENFKRQIGYLAKWFNVISVEHLARWLTGQSDLPSYAALITFDDGYMDNYTKAYPILRQHNLPALIFLTTDHIGTDTPFYWDLAAYCFHHTSKDMIPFPNGYERRWISPDERNAVSKEWIETMKTLSEAEKRTWVGRLPGILGVSIPDGYFRGLMMNWSLVRQMIMGGITFGGHTLNHPILTRIPADEAKVQITASKRRIEEETTQPVVSFAYPNGLTADINRGIEAMVAYAGYQLAFTLSNGPTTQKEVKDNPFTVRRIFISHNHSMARFASMLSPINRLRS